MRHKPRTCRDCGIEFSKKFTNKGRIDQCDDCSQDDTTIRAIGYNDGALNKSQNIAVLHGATPEMRKKVQGGRMV